MSCARSELRAIRALQTRQMRLLWLTKSLSTCCSQNPISRKRFETSSGADNSLMRTSIPARTRLSGHVDGLEHVRAGGVTVSFAVCHRSESFIVCWHQDKTQSQQRLHLVCHSPSIFCERHSTF